MATRAIKKLNKKDDLLELKMKNLELDESEDGEQEEANFKPKFSFNLVNQIFFVFKQK